MHHHFWAVGHRHFMFLVNDLFLLFFYSSFSVGILSCLWFIGWAFYAYNSPSEHPRITYAEKLYLLQCVPKPKKVQFQLKKNEIFILFVLVSNTLALYIHLCATLWYCCSTYLYEFCFLYITYIITNIFFNNSSI